MIILAFGFSAMMGMWLNSFAGAIFTFFALIYVDHLLGKGSK
jgi:hypothetical protein